jgi:hypothetical protein
MQRRLELHAAEGPVMSGTRTSTAPMRMTRLTTKTFVRSLILSYLSLSTFGFTSTHQNGLAVLVGLDDVGLTLVEQETWIRR